MFFRCLKTSSADGPTADTLSVLRAGVNAADALGIDRELTSREAAACGVCSLPGKTAVDVRTLSSSFMRKVILTADLR